MIHIGSKIRESPSPEGKKEANVGLGGFREHAAPGHQSYVKCFLFSMARLIEFMKLPGWSLAASYFFITSYTSH
eukprot:1139288-Pelagomonas_calceolata.AAC.2